MMRLVEVKDNMLQLSSLGPEVVALKVDNSAVVRNALRGSSQSLQWLHLAVRLRIGMLRDLRTQGLLSTEYVPSGENRSDIFTKALGAVKFHEQRVAVGVVSANSGEVSGVITKKGGDNAHEPSD